MAGASKAVSSGLGAGLGSVLGGGLGSVASSVINGLFQSGVTEAQKNLINAQRAKIEQDTRLELLSNDQKNALAEKMASVQTDLDREKLIQDAVSDSQVATINAYATIKAAQAKSASETQLIVFIGVGLVLVGGIYFLLKNND